MTLVDQLSDTLYREQAVKQLDRLLAGHKELPVKAAQIYGLRQIARQQPGKVKTFANHQRERVQKRHDKGSAKSQAEIDFWTLVSNLCSEANESTDWSVREEGNRHLPEELRNIPERQEAKTNEDRSKHNQLRNQRREWLSQWNNEHIPAFFERFCTHALYRAGTAEKVRKE